MPEQTQPSEIDLEYMDTVAHDKDKASKIKENALSFLKNESERHKQSAFLRYYQQEQELDSTAEQLRELDEENGLKSYY